MGVGRNGILIIVHIVIILMSQKKRNKTMEWMQVLTIVAATVGSTYAFYMITEKRIDQMDAALIRMDEK